MKLVLHGASVLETRLGHRRAHDPHGQITEVRRDCSRDVAERCTLIGGGTHVSGGQGNGGELRLGCLGQALEGGCLWVAEAEQTEAGQAWSPLQHPVHLLHLRRDAWHALELLFVCRVEQHQASHVMGKRSANTRA